MTPLSSTSLSFSPTLPLRFFCYLYNIFEGVGKAAQRNKTNSDAV